MKIKHLFLIVLLFVTGMVSAQQMGPIPVNKNVRQGKLSNGLTYYILHNEWPEHVANFYIAQRVGSIQENDNQRGLAHFLEHMAFNGSEHFPDSTLLEFTRSLGVEFGSNLMLTPVSTRLSIVSATCQQLVRQHSTLVC